MAHAITTQPPFDSLRAAYRPILYNFNIDNEYIVQKYTIYSVSNLAVVQPAITELLLPGDTITIGGGGAIDGSYTLGFQSTNGTQTILNIAPGAFPDGSWGSNCQIQINGALISKRTIPPVVYCDVYVNNKFYRTLSKTQYTAFDPGDPMDPIGIPGSTDWTFDIQDVCQEVLKKFLAPRGGTNILIANLAGAMFFVRMRYGVIDANGYTVSDALAPIQGTYDTDPVAGAGYGGNNVYVFNSTLQLENKQVFTDHLNDYKRGTWDANSYPMTHRPTCEIGLNESDYFPVISNVVPSCVRLNYKIAGAWNTATNCGACVAIGLGVYNIPAASMGVAYSYNIALTGSVPYAIDSSTIPAWMNVSIIGSNLHLSGMPNTEATALDVIIQVSNACGTATVTDTIDVLCVGITSDPYILPDATVGEPYSYNINLNGSAPFTISSTDIPGWMHANIVGNQLQLTGTPGPTDETTGLEITINVDNPCGTVEITDTIDVFPEEVIPLGVYITRVDANTLRAHVSGGTPPYTINWELTPSGSACASGSFSDPVQVLGAPGISDTDYTIADYSDASYTYDAFVTDNVGATQASNNISEDACLVPETRIRMKNGSHRFMKNLKPGMDLPGNNKVLTVDFLKAKKLFVINDGILKMSDTHLNIMYNGEKKHAKDLAIGERLVSEYGQPILIEKIEMLEGSFDVVNISTTNKTYIANGILTHNKLLC